MINNLSVYLTNGFNKLTIIIFSNILSDCVGLKNDGLTSLMRIEAFLTVSKNGVSEVYLKLPLFFSDEALYSLC